MFYSLWPYGPQPARLLHPWHSPDMNTGAGCHFLLQGIFLTQGFNWVSYSPEKIKSDTVSTVSSSISHEVMWPDAMILVFWMLSFKPTFSLSSFTFIKRLFSSSYRFNSKRKVKNEKNNFDFFLNLHFFVDLLGYNGLLTPLFYALALYSLPQFSDY